MARKLKTYITSLGFFDEAVAAPSMKAALEAWGSGNNNLFQKGFAKETDDPAIVAATMEAPGTVLKRPVGSKGAFKKHAELPHSIISDAPDDVVSKKDAPKKHKGKTKDKVLEPDNEAIKKYEQEEKRREKQRIKEEALREERAIKRDVAVAKGKSGLQKAEKDHDKIMEVLKAQQITINEKIEAEEAKWEKEQKRLEAVITKAEQ